MTQVAPDPHSDLDVAGAELVERLRQGDPAAWEQAYRLHERSLYRFVYHRLGRDPALAGDVFHDTFLKAVERISQFDPTRGDLAGWLRGIARNEVRQRFRARRTTSVDHLPDLADTPAPRDLGELVNLAFSQLSPRHQRALALKYYDGQSLEAIAESLETTAAAVGSLLHRARAAFREAYAGHTPGGSA